MRSQSPSFTALNMSIAVAVEAPAGCCSTGCSLATVCLSAVLGAVPPPAPCGRSFATICFSTLSSSFWCAERPLRSAISLSPCPSRR